MQTKIRRTFNIFPANNSIKNVWNDNKWRFLLQLCMCCVTRKYAFGVEIHLLPQILTKVAEQRRRSHLHTKRSPYQQLHAHTKNTHSTFYMATAHNYMRRRKFITLYSCHRSNVGFFAISFVCSSFLRSFVHLLPRSFAYDSSPFQSYQCQSM